MSSIDQVVNKASQRRSGGHASPFPLLHPSHAMAGPDAPRRTRPDLEHDDLSRRRRPIDQDVDPECGRALTAVRIAKRLGEAKHL